MGTQVLGPTKKHLPIAQVEGTLYIKNDCRVSCGSSPTVTRALSLQCSSLDLCLDSANSELFAVGS